MSDTKQTVQGFSNEKLHHDCKTIQFIINEHKTRGKKAFLMLAMDASNGEGTHLLQGSFDDLANAMATMMLKDTNARDMVLTAVDRCMRKSKENA